MIQEQLDKFLYSYSYSTLYVVTFIYFCVMYFGIAPLFNGMCKFLSSLKIIHKITLKEASQQQILFEIKHSFKSIVIFGTSVIPIIFLIRAGVIILLPNTLFTILLGLLILSIWNEVHFFIVHRIMHLSFFMRHVHYIHHQSKIPTVYSVYSFHWFEALLLSTVPLSIMPFVPLSIVSVSIYPLVSILLNYSGHCNYRFGNGNGKPWQLFGTHHNEHHFKGRKNYGFVLGVFDLLLSKFKPSVKKIDK